MGVSCLPSAFQVWSGLECIFWFADFIHFRNACSLVFISTGMFSKTSPLVFIFQPDYF